MSIESFDFKTGKKIDSRRRRVIISDIDMEDLATIQGVLREKRFQILGKEKSLKSLLELVRKHKMGMLMLDIDNPEVDFNVIVPDIKHKYPDMVVVLMASKVDKDTIQAAVKAGAAGFLVRPINKDSLKKILLTID